MIDGVKRYSLHDAFELREHRAGPWVKYHEVRAALEERDEWREAAERYIAKNNLDPALVDNPRADERIVLL